MEDLKCRICNNIKKNKIFKIKEMMLGFQEEFTYFQCSKCDCLQIYNYPNNIQKYYPSNYYSYTPKNSIIPSNRLKRIMKYLLYNCLVIEKKSIFSKFMFYFNQKIPDPFLKDISLLPLRKNMNILDVGCGRGLNLFYLKNIGFKNVFGVDPFIEDDIIYNNGLKIEKKSFYEVDYKMDLIIFHHTLEHMLDPIKIFQHISNLLKKDGICLVSIPIIPSFAWDNYKENWVQIDAPRHFFIFSIKNLKILAQNSDLILDFLLYNSNSFQFWGSEQYRRGISLISNNSYSINPSKSIFKSKEIKIFKKESKRLNHKHRGDQVTIFFKKKN